MITDCPSVADAIRSVYGEDIREVLRTSVSGGCINDAAVIQLCNKEFVFIKENTATLTGMFLAEAQGLETLLAASRRVCGPSVPEPLASGVAEGRQFILMEYIPPGAPGPRYAENFGRALAALHKDGTESRFGFFADNYIGASRQNNAWSDSWPAFFGEHRLKFQIEQAEKRGLASNRLARDVRRLICKLEAYLPSRPMPSILHGDLWSGNAMSNSRGEAVIIDPAAYFGHNEADLAMTELFGRFPSKFYDAYNEVLPISPEYKTRKIIYGLYHILNHLNLFGSGYESTASAMVRKLI
jgi:protein-ribulosamine 3-kinase